MQMQVEEAKASVLKEREAARKAIEEAPPVVKETLIHVEDTAKVNSLSAEVEQLKAMLQACREVCDATKKAQAGLNKKVADSEKKIEQLQDAVLRLEEKNSSLEEECKALRQQTVAMSVTAKQIDLPPKRNIFQTESPESVGPIPNGERTLPFENQKLLIECISQDLGFSRKRPMAACMIYRCLLHWRLFEVEKTSIFDSIIQTIRTGIETQDNKDKLAYWLSNSSTLLLILQKTLKTNGTMHCTPHRHRTQSAALFSKLPLVRGTPQTIGRDLLGGYQVEAKYPAILFKQQLAAFPEKIYGMIRDNLKKEISPLLDRCILVPRTLCESLIWTHPQANSHTHQSIMAHWQSIVKSLNTYLNIMKANFVPPFLVQKVSAQVFFFINVQLFNSILLRRECCSFSNGEYVKAGLAELEHWCREATDEYAGSAWDELKHIRQAVSFLVIHQKQKWTLEEITRDFCPELSVQQLYRICTMYWDDKYATHSVSSKVAESMRIKMTEKANSQSGNLFLLDDDKSIPFTVDDISKSLIEIEISDLDLPSFIRENSEFAFLL